jgi:tetratricopeptide (TPR) repeat protein
MRFSVLLVRAAAFLVFASPVAVSRAVAGDVGNQPVADDAGKCVHGTADEQIAACTALIRSGKWSGKGLAAVFGNRCFAYNKKGEFDRAIADCNQFLTLDPKNVHAFNSRGNSYEYKREYDRAIQDFDEAISLDPRYAAAFNNRGNAFHAKGQYDRAIQDYDEAIRLDPKNPVPIRNRDLAMRKRGHI